MAFELFKPFVMKKLVERWTMHIILRVLREWLKELSHEVWDVLEEVIKDHPVL